MPNQTLAVVERALLWSVICAVAVLAICIFPQDVVVNDHDYASQAMITHWVTQQMPWGKDVIQNVGPLGFISYPRLYSGELAGWKFVANAAMVLGIVIGLAIRNPLRPWQAAILIGVLSFYAYEDALPYLLLFTLFALPDRFRGAYAALRLVFFPAIALAKITFAVSILGFYLLALASSRGTRARLALGGECLAFILAFMAWWGILGQDVSNIPAFARGFASFSAGYTQTLLLYESWPTLAVGVAMFALIGLLIVRSARPDGAIPASSTRDSLGERLARLGLTFIVFKHAFVRADAHALVLVYYGISVAAIVAIEALARRRDGAPSLLPPARPVGMLAACIAVVLLGLILQSRTIPPWRHIALRAGEIANNVAFALSPAAHIAALNRRLEKNLAAIRSGALDAAINGESFSYYGHKPAISLLTRGRNIPTFSTISFVGWNRYIAERDLEKMAGERPGYFIVDFASIDSLYPPQNSPYLVRYILDNYGLVAQAGDVLLFKRRGGAVAMPKLERPEPNQVFEGRYDFPGDGRHHIAYIDVAPRLMDRVLSLLYKPPLYTMEVTFSDGSTQRYKTSRDHLRMGLSSQYVVRSNNELVSVMHGARPVSIVSLTVACRDVWGSCAVRGTVASTVAPAPRYIANPATRAPG